LVADLKSLFDLFAYKGLRLTQWKGTRICLSDDFLNDSDDLYLNRNHLIESKFLLCNFKAMLFSSLLGMVRDILLLIKLDIYPHF
jgi:hypothetical protein